MWLAACATLAAVVSAAGMGEVVVLPAEECVVTASLRPGDGMRLVGQAGSGLTGAFAGPLLEVSGLEAFELSGVRLRLGAGARGIAGRGVGRLEVRDVVVEGNTFRDNGSAGVYLQRAERPVVRLNTFVTDGLAVGTATGGVVADNLFVGAGPTPWRVGGAGVLVERMVVVP